MKTLLIESNASNDVIKQIKTPTKKSDDDIQLRKIVIQLSFYGLEWNNSASVVGRHRYQKSK